ncbi:hypothetical protein D3C87_1642750 [compost metagenome]
MQLVHVDPRRVLFVFDDFTKRLAGHVGARKHLKTRARPSVGAAFQDRHVGPAQAGQLGSRLVRQGLVIVHQHDARVAARHQPIGQQLKPP